MQTVAQQLAAAFRKAIAEAFDLHDVDPLISPSTAGPAADYQSNVAMGLAKLVAQKTGAKTNPRAVAEQILAKLDLGDISEGPPTVAGPGFINVRLNPAWLGRALALIDGENRLGVPQVERPQTVVVDYSGPNIAKQMHVGHLRSTIIGDAIARVLEFRGDIVIRQNHIGDWGTQFGMLIAFLRDTGIQGKTQIEDLDLFYKAARRRFESDEAFADTARATVVQLQAGDADARSMWTKIVAESRRHFQPIFDRLGVLLRESDERGESFYNSRLAADVAELRQSSIAVESDGAIVAFTEGSEAPLILEKTGGGYGYATTDLAAVRYRVGDLHAERVIYVVGAPQAQHFKQVFATARRAGWTNHASLEHAAFGSVVGSDGKMFKARSGDSVKLSELLDEAEERGYALAKSKAEGRESNLTDDELRQIGKDVGIGAVKYADLSKDRTSDYMFDWDKMLSMEGNTAPYLQYAHARIKSIFRKAVEQIGAKPGEVKLAEPHELALAKHLLRFGEIVDLVARELRPHLLCTYLYELATRFSGFYENCPVLQSDDATRASRLTLCDATAKTLAKGLDLLGIAAPERM